MKVVMDRGVPDQDFQNPAGTGFTGLFHEIRLDNPVSFCRIIRPEPDFSISKVLRYSSKTTRSDKNEKTDFSHMNGRNWPAHL